MYRIRSASGTEAVYNSLEEFNAAVRRGAVSAEDEIFHTRANRWLDVKSHPHYRSALTWAGSSEGAVAGVHAPARTPVPPAPGASRPAQPQAPQARLPQPSPERPALRPPQTVLRPQLVADTPPAVQSPAAVVAPPVAPPVPRKSKELAFIDLGTPAAPTTSQRNATVIEARKAPAAPAAKPVVASNAPGTEVEFLVMDGGIESPVRTSAGHRAMPQDLDLLFDRSLDSEKDPTGRSAVAESAAPIKPRTEESPTPPRAQVESPAAPREAPKQVVEAPVVETPKLDAPKVAPPKLEARSVEAPKPAAPKVEVPRSAPSPVVAEKPPVPPAPTMKAPESPIREDLSIPGGPLLANPTATVAPAPAATLTDSAMAVSGSPKPVMAAAGVAVVVVIAGLLAWKPWQGQSATPVVGTQSTASRVTTGSPAQAAPAPTIPSPAPESSTPTKSVPAGTKPSEAAVKTDTATAKGSDNEILAAARPNFRADAVVPSADLGLGNDIDVAGASRSMAAPSELTRRLEAAERQAQQDLAAKLGGFRGLLAANHLASSDGVSAARNAWSSGAESIRQYRAKIARLESAYQDSVLTSQRSQRWSSEEMRVWAGHQSAAEPVETSQLADLMFSQVNEGLDILAALQGQYDIKGSNITFKNPASGTRYTSIRTWVEQRTQAWAATPESARPHSVAAILRALGDGFPAAP